MSHSLSKIWIHSVFSTKDRAPLIGLGIEKKLYEHIKDELKNKFECKVRAINGMQEHIHILFLQNPNYSISEILKSIKGESSHWINFDNLTKNKFAWQTGYGAFSVSESMVKEVEHYIECQKDHHKKMTFMDEYKLFMKKYGLDILNR
jgi:putative transposase